MNFWILLGLGLLLWIVYDLYNGVTWTYKPIYRAYQPILYWIVTLIWLIVAVLTIYSGMSY